MPNVVLIDQLYRPIALLDQLADRGLVSFASGVHLVLALVYLLLHNNYHMKHPFGKCVKQLRGDRGWTVRELGRRAAIAFPNVALIESGRRACGAQLAERLASAFELDGEALARFRQEAARTTNRKPATLLGFVAAAWLNSALKEAAIDPATVMQVQRLSSGELELVLQNRTVLHAQVRLDRQAELALKTPDDGVEEQEKQRRKKKHERVSR